MSGGQFVSNEQRFSEQLERSVRGLEVINLSLEGSGTDQQLLIYESIGLRYEHDCVVLMPFLSNLRRNMVSAREAFDAKTGSRILRGKPRFELIDGQLKLKDVPVPREYPTGTAATLGINTDTPTNISHQLKAIVSHLPGVSYVKKVVYFLYPWEPFPEFCSANSPEWRLMEAIIGRFRTSADSKPIIIVPTFYDSYVRYRMARNYWSRFSSLNKIPGITVVDLLPHFLKLGSEGLRCFQWPHDVHFSSFGHLVLAEVLKSELAQIEVLRPEL
jgi:carbamoyltransferase